MLMGDYTRFPKITQELILRLPHVIAAFTLPAVQAAQTFTRSLPIVMTANDPVGAGLIQVSPGREVMSPALLQ
jgi:ABC-type uncharacterized transport system substrate-binding protein